MQQLTGQVKELDFKSETYKDAYSRINAIVIEGEQEAHENYITLAQLLPESHDELIRLSKMQIASTSFKSFLMTTFHLG